MEKEELEMELDDEIQEESTEELKARLEKAEADVDKWKNRFKSVAKKGNESKAPTEDINIDEIVDRKVAERDFYSRNEVAAQHKSEIQELQKKYNLEPEKAYMLYIAETKPQLLAKQTNTGVD